MIIFPAIDLVGGKAVRLYKGDYSRMTVYDDDPLRVAAKLTDAGATHVHLVDLDGAKSGETPNFEAVAAIKRSCGLFCEIGGGVRNIETVGKYLAAGIDRVILGTAAVEDEGFVRAAAKEYGDRIAVGVDVKDGFVAVRGWTERTSLGADEFFGRMTDLGVSYFICTDVSKDGAMQGTNRELYRELSAKHKVNITASGGVSSLDDVRALRDLGLYAAIIGKAYYAGAIDLSEAIKEAG